MVGTKKIDKSKKRQVVINTYEIIADMDGNPNSPAEFDKSPHDEGELYFKADEGATKAEKEKVLILNFIHQKIHHGTERQVPILDDANSRPDIEIYHRDTFQGVNLDVCVYWPNSSEGQGKFCCAMVKLTSDNLSGEHDEKGVVSTDTAWDVDAKADAFTKTNNKLLANYWAPRWKYVVNALLNATYYNHERNGIEKHIELEAPAEADGESRDPRFQEEKEEQMSVYSGSTGKIIGSKGAKIQEIRKASNVKDIKMPAKNEDGTRPKARELVEITIIGKPRAIAKARELIQEVVNEWANTPRPGYQPAQSSNFPTGGDAVGDHNSGGDDVLCNNNAVAGGETGSTTRGWASVSAGNW